MTNSGSIKFGTDGWRGVISDNFTFENLGMVAEATARFFKREKKVKNGIVVGYDARFMSDEYALHTARVIANRGIKVFLSDRIAPTPAVSLAVWKKRAAGGVVITASHNPARYNGFKLKGDYGGPAHPELIEKLEKKLQKILKNKRKSMSQKLKTEEMLIEKRLIRKSDITGLYINELRRKVDTRLINSGKIRMAFDAMYGAGSNIMGLILENVYEIRKEYNPSFGGVNPEPIAQNIAPLLELMKHGKYSIGIATDGDADRLCAVDEKGRLVDSHKIFALLLKYLHLDKGVRGEVVKTISVTDMVDKICLKYKIPLHTTPVGFKYICRLMTERDVLIGGEESGGIGVKNHIPERDGIYIGLLLCEMMINKDQSLGELVDDISREFGEHHFDRKDMHLTQKEQTRVMKAFAKGFSEIAGYNVIKRDDMDGHKFIVKNGWLLVRASGTEPLIRFYAEGDTPGKVEKLLNFAVSI